MPLIKILEATSILTQGVSGGDFSKANFMDADLRGIKYLGANLEGAKFLGARNIPIPILNKLDRQGVFRAEDNARIGSYDNTMNKSIFISKPSVMSPEQETVYRLVCNQLESDGYNLVSLEVNNYQYFGILSEIKRLIQGCHAVVLFGFKQYKATSKVHRWWDETNKQEVDESFFASSWVHTEAGIASAYNLPLLLISDFNIDCGVFEDTLTEPLIFRMKSQSGFKKQEFQEAYNQWSNSIDPTSPLTTLANNNLKRANELA